MLNKGDNVKNWDIDLLREENSRCFKNPNEAILERKVGKCDFLLIKASMMVVDGVEIQNGEKKEISHNEELDYYYVDDFYLKEETTLDFTWMNKRDSIYIVSESLSQIKEIDINISNMASTTFNGVYLSCITLKVYDDPEIGIVDSVRILKRFINLYGNGISNIKLIGFPSLKKAIIEHFIKESFNLNKSREKKLVK